MQLSKTRSELYQKQAGKNIGTWDEIRQNRKRCAGHNLTNAVLKKVNYATANSQRMSPTTWTEPTKHKDIKLYYK